jgi:DNA-binding GntR family transcriptional regulator
LTLSPRSLLRQQSLQEQAYHALRRAIFSGELKAGQRLVETQLATRLQVSRTPIREAIRLLQHENLAMIDPSGVLRVATISATDAAQLYDCRLALERLSVLEACAKASAAHVQNLEKILLQSEEFKQNSTVSESQLLELDYQFHRLLAQSSGNAWLVALLEQVFDKMLLLRLQTTFHNPQVLEIRVEHRRIFEAIAARSPHQAIAAMEGHLNASKVRVVKEVQDIQTTAARSNSL